MEVNNKNNKMSPYTFDLWELNRVSEWCHKDNTDKWPEAKEWLLTNEDTRCIVICDLQGSDIDTDPDVVDRDRQIHSMEDISKFETNQYWDQQVDNSFEEPKISSNYDSKGGASHYKDIVPGYEYFDIMDYVLKDFKGAEAHALGNAFKYLFRLGRKNKDTILEDSIKSSWYLNRFIEYQKAGGFINYAKTKNSSIS